MFFVLKQETFYGKTVERNLRMGGLLTMKAASNLANREGPCLIRDHERRIVGQNINAEMPYYVGKMA